MYCWSLSVDEGWRANGEDSRVDVDGGGASWRRRWKKAWLGWAERNEKERRLARRVMLS